MLDRLIDHLVGRFLTRTATTAHDHREALKGHTFLQRVFFHDLKEADTVPPPDDHPLCDGYGVTC